MNRCCGADNYYRVGGATVGAVLSEFIEDAVAGGGPAEGSLGGVWFRPKRGAR